MESDDDDVSSVKSTEEKTSVTESVWSVYNIDNGPRVKYEPDKMWFDYQALFDKTKSAILEQNLNVEVKHTDFEENKLARQAVFGRDKYYSSSLKGIMDGELNSLYSALSNIGEYLDIDCYKIGYSERKTLSQEDFKLVDSNYRYFLGINVSLCDYSRHVMEEYRNLTGCYLPKSVTTKNIFKINFKEVIDAYEP